MKHHVRVDVVDALARAAVGLIHKLYILADKRMIVSKDQIHLKCCGAG